MKITIGRTVHYRLSEDDVRRIANQRGTADTSSSGNHHHVGQTVPLVVVVVWPNEYGPAHDGVNGQALLDGPDSLWVTSAKKGTEPGTWSWPERVPAEASKPAEEVAAAG